MNQETRLKFEAEQTSKNSENMSKIELFNSNMENKIKLQQELLEDTRKSFLSRVARLESELVAARSRRRVADEKTESVMMKKLV